MTGEVGHFEIPADDVKRAQRFYATTFGWKMVEMPGMDYTMVNTGAVDQNGRPIAPGYVSGGIAKRGPPVERPVVTIMVDEITLAQRDIERNGGVILQERKPVGDGSMGHTAYFRDSEGNTVGLYEPPKTPPTTQPPPQPKR